MSMTVKEISDFIKLQETVMGMLLRQNALMLLLRDKGIFTDEEFDAKIQELGTAILTKAKEVLAAQPEQPEETVHEVNNSDSLSTSKE